MYCSADYGRCPMSFTNILFLGSDFYVFPVYKRHFVFFSRWSLSICRAYTSFALGAPKIYSRWNFTNSLFLTEGFTISGLIGAILDSRMSVYDNTSAYPSWNYEQNTYGYTKTYTCSKLIDIAHLWATFFRNQLTSINHANNIFRSGAHEDMKLVDENVCCF